jgi:hypothetical protein
MKACDFPAFDSLNKLNPNLRCYNWELLGVFLKICSLYPFNYSSTFQIIVTHSTQLLYAPFQLTHGITTCTITRRAITHQFSNPNSITSFTFTVHSSLMEPCLLVHNHRAIHHSPIRFGHPTPQQTMPATQSQLRSPPALS